MLGSAEVCPARDQDQAHFTEAASLVFYMILFLLVLLFHFSIEQSLAPRQCLDFLCAVLMCFPACECIPMTEQQQGLSMVGNTSSCTGTLSQQQTSRPCLARNSALPKTYLLFSFEFLHSFRNGEIPQRCICLSI